MFVEPIIRGYEHGTDNIAQNVFNCSSYVHIYTNSFMNLCMRTRPYFCEPFSVPYKY